MSAVYDVLERPDWAATTTIRIPTSAPTDPSRWTNAVFSVEASPGWVRSLMALRQLAVRLIGVSPAPDDVFAVDRVVGQEAIVEQNDRHLRFVAGITPDPGHGLLHVVTAVQFHGWRGRVYFVPVRFLHDQVTRSMMTRAARRMAVG